MISIVDYGLGNVQAIANIYRRLNIPVCVACSTAQLSDAEKIVLPGVGAFDWAMTRLSDSGMRDRLDDLVMRERRDVLGICVGMQMLATRSDEGQLAGLGWIDGDVKILGGEVASGKMHLPHMGWNDVLPSTSDCLFKGLGAGGRFYFLHSYYFAARDERDVLATADYGGPFACSVRRQNVFGVQFHPEKSHGWGIELLKNFAEL